MTDTPIPYEHFIDGESSEGFMRPDDFNIRMIAMRHYAKILSLSCVEFRGGYWETKIVDGKIGVPVYVPDTRDQYCNAVDALYDVLLPQMLNKKFESFYEAIKKADELIESERVEFLRRSQSKSVEVLTVEAYNDDDRTLFEAYKFARLRLHRKLFQELSIFLKKINYLEKLGLMDNIPSKKEE